MWINFLLKSSFRKMCVTQQTKVCVTRLIGFCLMEHQITFLCYLILCFLMTLLCIKNFMFMTLCSVNVYFRLTSKISRYYSNAKVAVIKNNFHFVAQQKKFSIRNHSHEYDLKSLILRNSGS